MTPLDMLESEVVFDRIRSRRRLGRYLIEGELGQGAMGFVYRAFDSWMNRRVALKFLHPRLAAKESAWDLFSREARCLARVDHPSVVRIFDHGVAEGVLPYHVCECIPGMNMKRWIGNRRGTGGLLAWVFQALDGLRACHEAGVLHRDIKPSNLQIAPDGRAVLIDFGLALDGPARAELQRRLPHAVFTGALTGEPLAAAYASADIFVFPSLTETFGNVVTEAMASGLAVCAFDTAAAHQHIQDRFVEL